MQKTIQLMREDWYNLAAFFYFKLRNNFFEIFFVQEIQPEDVKLAVKLSDTNMTNSNDRESVAGKVRDYLQKKSITELADRASVLHRYPADMFMQRSHTYIPGGEAYTEDDEANEADEMEVDAAGHATSGGNGENTAASTSISSAVKFTPGARTGTPKYLLIHCCAD